MLLKLHKYTHYPVKLAWGTQSTHSIKFDPMEVIGSNVGGGHSFAGGCYFARLQYINFDLIH